MHPGPETSEQTESDAPTAGAPPPVGASDYLAFLAKKSPRAEASGFEPQDLPDHLFPFQSHVVRFLVRAGRAACFLDTGLGKGRIALQCLQQCANHTKRPTLHVVPLMVANQIVLEGKSLGYQIKSIRDETEIADGINVINYDRLHLVNPQSFCAISLDESDILASLTGAIARKLIEDWSIVPYRFCFTATPAPNDHTELGAHSEFLGVMRSMEMLSRWFINDTSTASQEWRLKSHAVNPFWD